MAMEAVGPDPNQADPAATSTTAPKEKPEKKYSTPDGPRYTASLQTIKDKTCYKDFFESEKLAETTEAAKAEALKTGRAAMIFDRRVHEVIQRIPAKEIEKTEEVVKKRGGITRKT